MVICSCGTSSRNCCTRDYHTNTKHCAEQYCYDTLNDSTGLFYEEEMRFMRCVRCKGRFILAWDSYGGKPITLQIRGCPSGGVYDVSIICPYCDHEEGL